MVDKCHRELSEKMLDIVKAKILFSSQSKIWPLFFLGISLFLTTPIFSQTQSDTSSSEKVLVENADNSITEIKDGTHVQYLRNNVRLIHDSIYMFCDSARIMDNELIAVGEVIVIQDDTINIFSDSLIYNSDLKIGELFFNVVLENGSKKLFTEKLIYKLEEKKAFFNDTTTLLDGTMKLSSLRGMYDVQIKQAKFYDQVSIIDEDFRLKTDSLLYDTDIDRAYFLGPTYITQGNDKVYCEDGYYDLKAKRAYFSDNPIMYNEEQSASGGNISYDGVDSLFIITENAVVEDSTSYAKGDVITKNSKKGTILIEGNGYYRKGDREIYGPYIEFNEKTEAIFLNGRSTVYNEKGWLKGDTIKYNKVDDFGTAIGSAIWRDTVENIIVEADRFEYKENSGYYKAIVDSVRPLFRQEVDGDTLFLSADTLLNGSIGDSINYLQAIRSVKIFKSDLQAVCDSLYYSDVDSTFVLYDNPISWSDTTQFFGDTLSIKMTNDKVSDIIASNNAFISSVDFAEYYNQIKGRFIHSFLDSNKLDRMLIRGNAESIYMIKDDEKKYIGPNYTACGHMMFYFDNDELEDVMYYAEPSSKMTPMKKAGSGELYLEGFKWYREQRPENPYNIRKLVLNTFSTSHRNTVQDTFAQSVKDVIFKQGNNVKDRPKREKK